MTDRYTLDRYETTGTVYSAMCKGLEILNSIGTAGSEYFEEEERKAIRECIKALGNAADRISDKKMCLRIEIRSKLDERPEVLE